MNNNKELYRLSSEEIRLVMDYRRLTANDQQTVGRLVHDASAEAARPRPNIIPFRLSRTAH